MYCNHKKTSSSFELITTMMTKPDPSDANEQICPLCKKLISKHSPEQMLECSKKLQNVDPK